MSLTSAQRDTVKADILANSDMNTASHDGDGAFMIAALYGANASPDYWVWRTNVSRAEIYNNTSVDATNWSWQFYKSQSVTEQNSWVQMFMGDQADFSKPNLRAGISNIFTSASAGNATHALAIGKRLARRIEKLLATGTGAKDTPSTMGYEGTISGADILLVMGW